MTLKDGPSSPEQTLSRGHQKDKEKYDTRGTTDPPEDSKTMGEEFVGTAVDLETSDKWARVRWVVAVTIMTEVEKQWPTHPGPIEDNRNRVEGQSCGV